MKFQKYLGFCIIGIVLALQLFANNASANRSGELLVPESSLSPEDQALALSVANQLMEKVGHRRTELMRWMKAVIGEQETRADFLTCDICLPILSIVRPLLTFLPKELVIQAVIIFCIIGKLAPSDALCSPTIRNFAEPVIYIATQKKDLTNQDFCGIINSDCGPVSPELSNWATVINATKPAVVTRPLLPANERGIKIAQFTDIHLDLDYYEGGWAHCDFPICCRIDTNRTGDNEEVAGPYGHYNCALPPKALDAVYDHAKTVHSDVQYVFLTGDYIHSGVWLYNEVENSRHITSVADKLKASFPNAKIIPLTGNHEAAPCNMYAPQSVDEFNNRWMYQATVGPFEDLFDGAPAEKENFLTYGYYSVKPDPATNLRLVILNTNICYINNFWLAFDPVDPGQQLQWFANTMQAAENQDEHVMILAHISPGSGSCWTVWSNQYDRIVHRYENNIRAQFFGHSHTDYFSLAFDRESTTERAISTLYISPSMLTDGMNSGYKVFYADGARGMDSTWEIIDFETWILNTIESNNANQPIFQKLYSAKDDYGLETLRASDMYDFVVRMISDNTLFQKYEMFHYKNTSSTSKYRPCKNDSDEPGCIVNRLCSLVKTNSGDNSHCLEIGRLMEEHLKGPVTTEKPEVVTDATSSLRAGVNFSLLALISTIIGSWMLVGR